MRNKTLEKMIEEIQKALVTAAGDERVQLERQLSDTVRDHVRKAA